MRIRQYAGLFCLALGITPAADATSSSPVSFYQSLIAGIKNAAGTMVLDLGDGFWKSGNFTRPVLWRVQAGTTAVIKFEYTDGVLVKASVTFDPPIHAAVTGKGAADIQSVEYNLFGDATTLQFKGQSSLNPSGLVDVKRTLNYARNPQDLFSGKPFPEFVAVNQCDASGIQCASPSPMIHRVRFLKTGPSDPGLKVDFRDQAVIFFSRPDAPDGTANLLTVREGSGFQFDEIDYDVDETQLHGLLSSFKVIAERGTLSTAEFALNLQGGSTLQLSNIRFLREQSGTSQVDARYGTLLASLGAGSKISFSTGAANSTSLTLDDGSTANIQGLLLAVDDSGSIQLQVGNGSAVDLKLHDARLGFAHNGFLAAQPGRLVGQLSGTWASGQRPRVLASVTLLDVAITGGSLDLNTDSTLRITGGALKSTALQFNSAVTPSFTGTISDANLLLAEDNRIGVPGGMQFVTDIGAKLTVADPNALLEFRPGMAFPLGAARIDLPFKRMANARTASFALTAGKATVNLANQADRTLSGTFNLRGTMYLDAQGVTLSSLVSADEGTIAVPTNGNTVAKMKLKAAIPPTSPVFVVRTPFVKGYTDSDGKTHDDFRAFPLNIAVSIAQEIDLPVTPITFTGSSLAMDPIVLKPKLRVSIPPGSGEHEDKNDENSANGQHGPDEDKHLQEATYDKFPACDAHIYLQTADYDFSSELRISLGTDNQINIGLAKLVPDRALGFNRDGCDTSFFGAIAGAIAGALLGGPFGVVPGAIIGHQAGSSLNDHINDLIAAAVAKKIMELQFSWHIRV